MRKRQLKGSAKDSCKCGNVRRKGGRYCRECHAAYMRSNRPKHSELSSDAKKKANARAYLREYIRRGHITKQPCIICGNRDSEGHHKDYNKPLEVVWLCREHHLYIHQLEE
jgi:hypothetical protein